MKSQTLGTQLDWKVILGFSCDEKDHEKNWFYRGGVTDIWDLTVAV